MVTALFVWLFSLLVRFKTPDAAYQSMGASQDFLVIKKMTSRQVTGSWAAHSGAELPQMK
jgi:hypothetical protein